MAREREREELNKPAGTVIGGNLTINAATITGAESIRVDGVIIGNINLDGTLFLSDTGRIEGDINISAARIAGKVTGNINCRSTIHMASTAVVKGDITTAALIVDDGAALYGLCKTRMTDNGQLLHGDY